MSTNKRFERFLHERMPARNIKSIMELERKSGIPTDTLRQFIAGRTKTIKHPYLLGLSQSLGVTVEELISIVSGKNIAVAPPKSIAHRAAPTDDTIRFECFKARDMASRSAKPLGGISIDKSIGLAIPTSNAKWVQADDDAMRPVIGRGDVVLVDTSVRDVAGSGIYFLRGSGTGATPMLRRVSVKPAAGKIDIAAEDPAHGVEENIAPDSVDILGLALMVLKFL